MREPEPGQELDELVAERVMGLRRQWCRELGEMVWKEPDDFLIHRRGPPQYSTDISAALGVLDRVTDHGEPCEIQYHLVGKERFASVTLNTCPEWRGISLSGLPHAICLAALKVVERKEGAAR